MEKETLTVIRHYRNKVCTRVANDSAGEAEELWYIMIGGKVASISDTTWFFGGLVRKAATHVSADANTLPDPDEE